MYSPRGATRSALPTKSSSLKPCGTDKAGGPMSSRCPMSMMPTCGNTTPATASDRHRQHLMNALLTGNASMMLSATTLPLLRPRCQRNSGRTRPPFSTATPPIPARTGYCWPTKSGWARQSRPAACSSYASTRGGYPVCWYWLPSRRAANGRKNCNASSISASPCWTPAAAPR